MSYRKPKTLVQAYAIFIYVGVEKISIPASKLQCTANQIEVSTWFSKRRGQKVEERRPRGKVNLRAELEHNG